MAQEDNDNQKTEQPTSRRLDDAIDKGDVLQSPDVIAWAMLASSTLLAFVWLAGACVQLTQHLKTYLSGAGAFTLDGATAVDLARRAGGDAGTFLAVPFAVLIAVAIAAHLLQRPFVFNLEKAQPNFSKINPMSGLDRLFGRQALIQYAKGLVKIICVALAAFWVLWPERRKLGMLVDLPLTKSLDLAQHLLLTVLIVTLIVYGVIAVLDYGWQYWERLQRLKMTRQEIKDEFKNSEGDPHIKGRLRQIRQEKARQRMMAAVPKASVVVTNPTHYAVALKYDPGMSAPVVVAKGVDFLALRIREIASQNNVPVIENPPLARALYATVEIDDAVKPEHYKAVAQLIGFVMRLRGQANGSSPRPNGPAPRS